MRDWIDPNPRGLMTPDDRMKMREKVSSMSMTIYSDDMANIQKCIDKLDEKLDQQYMERKIDQYLDIVKSLTTEEVRVTVCHIFLNLFDRKYLYVVNVL